jgi:hypothetical protein
LFSEKFNNKKENEMKFIKGTEEHVNRCGGNCHCWLEVSTADLENNPGAVAEPTGSFNCAACYVAREIVDGLVVDVRVVANPSQKYWDCTYDQYMVAPTKGGAVEIERLDLWFNVYTVGSARKRINADLHRTVINTMWRKACKHATTTEGLLSFIRAYVAKHPKALGLSIDGLWVD